MGQGAIKEKVREMVSILSRNREGRTILVEGKEGGIHKAEVT